MGCEGCTIARMKDEGCCTQLVDTNIGTKLIRNRRLGRRLRVCANLVVNDGSPYCGGLLQ